jgi:hypothetical protein
MKKIFSLILFCFALLSNNVKAQSGESPITLELPETTYIGAAVKYSGTSVLYKNFKTVKISITGPKSYVSALEPSLDKKGEFSSYWVAPTEFGEYTFTATSSDGKETVTKKVRIESIDFIEKMADESIVLIDKATKIVEDRAKDIQSKITAEHKKALEEKLQKFRTNIEQYNAVFKSIKEAAKKVKKDIKPGQVMPRNMAHHLNELNTVIDKQEAELKRVNEYYNHKPSNYTICDYLNGFKEVLAAYGTITTFAQKSVKTVLQNIALNNALPVVTNKQYEMAGAAIGAETGDVGKFIATQIAKNFTAPYTAANTLDATMGKVGMATDVLGFIVDVLMKYYCITFTNKITQNNNFTFVNEYQENWYVYKSRLQGILSLRAPKADGSSNIIKMKGSIEGNLTGYKATADPKACIAKELKDQGVYKNTFCIPLVETNPVMVPFSTAANDVGGFGFGARMVATPACFNIQVDAEYDVAKKEIKLFIIKANAIDFTPAVKFRQLFAYGNVIPLAMYQDYPIEKAAITFFANFKEKNTFPIIDKGKGEKTFSGNVKRTVKDEGFTIDLNATIEPE